MGVYRFIVAMDWKHFIQAELLYGCMEQGNVLPSCVTDCELQELKHPHLCDCREETTLVGRDWSYKPAPPDLQGWEGENGPLIII